ncbi:hypothetical protein [Domibacillus indicus]|uniref:hypothetical protein n=1 Tax=Domibacillus indicus TaxID=1437523 RepID=UPI0006182035|nr:hypothetical protein [Domibacillus indicus]
MRQVINYLAISIVSIGSYWMYTKQWGAVPFLLLSIFFFYKAYDEVSGRAQKRRTAKEISRSTAPGGKKAEIIT